MRKHFLLFIAAFVLLVSLFSSIPVHAQPHIPTITDWREEGGRKIPVDADGDDIVIGAITGAEQSWVRDATDEDNIRYYLMDKEYNIIETRTQEEMQPLIDKDPTDSGAGQSFETDDADEVGSLTLTAIVPKDVDGKDVVVTLYNGVTTADYHLYSTNNYETTEIVPVGTYSVVNVRIQGDVAQTYTASYADSVEVTEDGGAYYTFDFDTDVSLNRPDMADSMEEGEEEQGMKMWQKVLLGTIGGFVLAGVCLGVAVAKKSME